MSGTNLEKVLEEVKTLTAEELMQVRNLIDSILTHSTSASTEDLLNQRLLASGLIRRIPPRTVDSPSQDRFTPVEISGEPLSEIIIRERR